MNIGIDFNIKTTKAAFSVNGSNLEDCGIFKIKNILVLTNDDIFAGDDGLNKFLIEKDSKIFDLDQIIEWNGLVVNKRQISAEKCLSIIFAHLLKKINNRAPNGKIDFICISIPYDKFYYWHDLIRKAFALIETESVRIISQPAAFFSQPDINHLLSGLNQEKLRKEQRKKYIHKQEVEKYEKLSWHKKLLSKRPKYREENESTGCLFVSISQDNTNVSLIDYGEDVLEIVNTQYTNSLNRRKIENSVLEYFISEIGKDSRNFALKDRKTLLRISEEVGKFLRTPHSGKTFELNLPYVLCEDGRYRTLDTKIDSDALREFLAPTFDSLVKAIKQLALKTQEVQRDYKYQTKFGDIILVGDLFIQQNIQKTPPKILDDTKIKFGNEKSLAVGAFSFSRIMTGENKDFLALEVIPFSVLIRLRGEEFIEMIKKDSVIPTISKEHSLEIRSSSKQKFVEVHLTTKEGNAFQSLNVWKIEIPNTKVFKVTVNVEANMKIGLNAYSENGQKLSVQRGNTFSFKGTGFEVGIKGKDIRQYILNQFNYLNVALNDKEVVIFEPDETFYSMLREGEPFKALRYLGYFLKLKSLPDVKMTESKSFEEQGIGGFISGSKISIPKSFTKDPHGFGYILAHELAHYILIHEEQMILDDEQENEILTEIFVVYSGMGKLLLNGFNAKEARDFTSRTCGYLNEKIIKYIHQIYFEKFNIAIIDYEKGLTKEGLKILKD